MAYEVSIEKINDSFAVVSSPEMCVHEELYEHFKVKDPSHTPSRFSRYDGMVRLYDKNTGKIPVGLLPQLLKQLKNYKVTLDPSFKNLRVISREELQTWILEQNLPFELFPFQFDIVYDSIKFRRLCGLADTGAGKSVAIYLITKFLYEMGTENILIMVPTIQLVNQILQDFVSYGWKEAPQVCQQILAGKSKVVRKPVTISTWQSIQDMSPDYFEIFRAVIVDEVHCASAAKQSKIIERCRFASDRIGLTGTLRGTELHSYQVGGHFGPIRRYVETQELKDLGQASQTQVYMVYMKYDEFDRKRFKDLDYEGSIQYSLHHKGRTERICDIVTMLSKMGENTLLICERVGDGVYKFKEHLEELGFGDKVRVIEGETKLEERDRIKNEIEEGEGIILIATWGTLSTGINIKKLHNLVLSSSTKGVIRVLQTLGRLLRIHETKKVAKIFDIIDDTRMKVGSFGFFIGHAKERYSYYTEKKHPIKSISKTIGLDKTVTEEKYLEIKGSSDKRKKDREEREALELVEANKVVNYIGNA